METTPTKIKIAKRGDGGLMFKIDGRDYAHAIAADVQISRVGPPLMQEFGVTVTFLGAELHVESGVVLLGPDGSTDDAAEVIGRIKAAEIEP